MSVASIEALGFVTSAALCAMLLYTHWRLRDRRENAPNYVWLWITGFMYAAAAFAATMLQLALPIGSRAVTISESIAWCSTCLGPPVFASICEPLMRQGVVRRALKPLAVIAALGLAARAGFIAATSDLNIGDSDYPEHAFYVSLTFAIVSAVGVLAHPSENRAIDRVEAPRWFGSFAIGLAAVQCAATIASIHQLGGDGPIGTAIRLASTLWILPWTVLLSFLLAQTRYADVALKRSLVLLTSVAITGWMTAWLFGRASGTLFVVATVAMTAVALSAPSAYRVVHRFVDRVLLRRPEYRELQRTFAQRARRIAGADELIQTASRMVGETLRVEARFVLAGDAVTSALAVVPAGAACVLEVQSAAGARSLMQEEHAFLEAIAAEVGHRLESLEMDVERNAMQVRETQLRHLLTEAELRALRAQVDPHFLFNTLNTIADLISANPPQAEAMTERLAECFRYALSRQDRMLSTLDEELQFVRRYLDIEQVRFGERLRVEMASDAALATEKVPSLILQPLVENAVRHGLAPKPAGGRVRVSVTNAGDYLQLEVMDDGVGIATSQQRSGIGLRNVRERLTALYRERAEMRIGPGALGHGTTITLRLPKHAH